ncbi:uncharacterized protein AMSG_09748 [Thecamonas trahens ATCC 50062]|uniref:Glycosyl hydrolase family 43 protein n=1 Tax=Thecamonas trahens ATCC 50062 TaxID=461836 RepID=A0A0L0DRN5_THETB|nr:hypothetical protein AMSG_09748 [Thecamonas trahens ATCC 50062]KNC54083.1 hypothetical protein AMSG_09748 [Thecamonas trahens ATCC 50062]|eukprot:XP_013754092.1 hypothetical protein AMSG_09748 [Thecamonas trahens ATCC 50062]
MWASHPKTPVFGKPVEPYYLTSTDDGASWTIENGGAPVIEVGGTGSYDEAAAETPSVAYFSGDGKYHMYYTAQEDALDVTTWSIGHAVSASPAGPWIKDASPVITRNSAGIGSFVVAEPGVVESNGELLVFFTSVVGFPSPAPMNTQYDIALATSTNGTHFTGHKVVLNQDATIWTRGDGYIGFSTPAPAIINGLVYLFHDVYKAGQVAGCSSQETTQAAVSYAHAASPAATFTPAAAPIYRRSDFLWSACELRAGNAIINGDKIVLFIAGQNVSSDFNTIEYGVAMAEAPLPPPPSPPPSNSDSGSLAKVAPVAGAAIAGIAIIAVVALVIIRRRRGSPSSTTPDSSVPLA